jgi:hypothetical protein
MPWSSAPHAHAAERVAAEALTLREEPLEHLRIHPTHPAATAHAHVRPEAGLYPAQEVLAEARLTLRQRRSTTPRRRAVEVAHVAHLRQARHEIPALPGDLSERKRPARLDSAASDRKVAVEACQPLVDAGHRARSVGAQTAREVSAGRGGGEATVLEVLRDLGADLLLTVERVALGAAAEA